MKDKIKELRTLIPIPMGEALTLLKENDGDVQKCFEIFKAQSIQNICAQTGCNRDMADEYYKAEKYDFNRTISMIQEAIYDANYKPIEGLTDGDLRATAAWLRFMGEEGFDAAIESKQLETAIEVFGLISSLNKYGELLKDTKRAKDIIFEGYTETDSIEEFVKRNNKLDDVAVFQQTSQLLPLSITTIEKELSRHLRNIKR